jgi:hypothetical protein
VGLETIGEAHLLGCHTRTMRLAPLRGRKRVRGCLARAELAPAKPGLDAWAGFPISQLDGRSNLLCGSRRVALIFYLPKVPVAADRGNAEHLMGRCEPKHGEKQMSATSDLIEDWIQIRSMLQRQLKTLGSNQADVPDEIREGTINPIEQWIADINSLLKEYTAHQL